MKKLWVLLVMLLTVTALASSIRPRGHDSFALERMQNAPTRGANWEVLNTELEAKVLLERIAKEKANVWYEGDVLTFAKPLESTRALLCCGLQIELRQAKGDAKPPVWYASIRITDLPRAVLSYSFIRLRYGQPVLEDWAPKTWRGPEAPPEPTYTDVNKLQGRFIESKIQSRYLKEERGVGTYLPPQFEASKPHRVVFMTDGQSAVGFARGLEPAIQASLIPPVVIIGAHASTRPKEPSEPTDRRNAEYVRRIGSPRWALHEKFFLEELIPWAEREYKITKARDERALMGFSSGGGFTAVMATLHPNVFGFAFPFSPNDSAAFDAKKTLPALFIQAGTLEDYFLETAQVVNSLALEANPKARVELRIRVGGHDSVLWDEEFINAVRWAWGSNR
jgi:predicted alpha/beta superfamily hydrolase